MDPFNTVDFARIRFDTSILMKRLKKACETDIEDLSLNLDDKKKAVEEKINAATLEISTIQGQVTSTLDLSKRLITNFTVTVMEHIEDIDRGLVNKSENVMRFTRAAYGPGVLSRHLDEFWDQIPSTIPPKGLSNLTDIVQVHEKKLEDLTELADSLNDSFRTIEEELKFPNKTVLAKVFGDSENMCKLRKKSDKTWDNKPEDELIAELNVNQRNLAISKITPKGRGTPFLKLTFLTSEERRDATSRLNSLKLDTGYIISPVEPRECQNWLPRYKTGMRNVIMAAFIDKGYDVSPDDFFIQMQWRFSPEFRFVWRVRIKAYNFNNVLESDNIISQVPELGRQTRNDGEDSTQTVDISDINKEAIILDVKKVNGSDKEDFVPSTATTEKETELVSLSIELVQGVIQLSKNFQHQVQKIKKVRVTTSNSKYLAPLLKTYSVYKEQVGEGQIPDTYYQKPQRAYKTIATMLKDGKFSGS